ncbi:MULTISPECIES: ABC transporter ATP-binding protein [unclassified Pseudodesulfovibrio]|uniref:ABC transporter ATP-binding protein n=1 Tax=unclassified Pseudodesulfovibrio TaxID=2661612 RepID=UPI000FEBBB00|nr:MULTISPECIES: ABC transporter ATP-binding protein [unclassified Pseudodesulfovibrio]MCJ2163955.1 ABC transporter ATP-binding protein [Pseudodesulfovibrio sp. S3-i]RWU05800.1 ABC transporter ATP-binding protein [Pseudodesulfovibrio sp. S3]
MSDLKFVRPIRSRSIPEGVQPVVSLKGVTKRFGKVLANDSITLDVYPGRIKALLGENGAGKSTMMSMLAGRYKPDEGTIEVDGKPVRFSSSKDAIAAGIGMVYQHFMLVDSMTVAENVLLGQEGKFFINPKEMTERVGTLAVKYGLDIDPGARICDLSMGERQLVEILKLLYRESRILIFDEPTAVLTPEETGNLFEALWRMTEEGKSIIFISHKLEEVIALADEIAILRRGRIEGELDPDSIESKSDLASRMVGKEVLLEVNREPVEIGNRVLEVRNLTGLGLTEVDLEVYQGEIVALVGVAGNGQKALVEAVTGLSKPPLDTVFIMGKPWRQFFAESTWNRSMCYIPEDRLGLATLPNQNLVDNLLLTTRKGFAKGMWLNKKQAARDTVKLIEKFDIRPGRIHALAWQLSGGNLQKAVLARELFREPKLIVAEQPTQGLDVSATEEVWNRLLQARSMAGVLLVTGDLNEALQLADRIAVIYRGQILDILSTADRGAVRKIGPLMAGIID